MSAEQDRRHPIDARVDTPQREGLTGTAPTSLYLPIVDPDEITRAPDGKPLAEQPKWRRDFPIDTPQDLYVGRRDFMKFMVLTSLAFTVGQFWIAVQNWLRRRRGAPELKRIASLADIPVGGAITFLYPEPADRCILVRPAADVVSDRPEHVAQALLIARSNRRKYCQPPWHQARESTPRPVRSARGSGAY